MPEQAQNALQWCGIRPGTGELRDEGAQNDESGAAASEAMSEAAEALSRHYHEVRHLQMRDLFAADPERFERLSIETGDLLQLTGRAEVEWLDAPPDEPTRVERMLRFTPEAVVVRRGALLDDEAKARVKEINARIAELNTVFGQNLLKQTKSYELLVTDEVDLAGLPSSMIGSARAKAESKGQEGWVFGLDRGTYEGFMTFADNRELRKELNAAYRARGAQGDEQDNRDILTEVAKLRAERAQLMGYPNHAAYVLETNMAKTPEKVDSFLGEVWEPGLAKAREELAEMRKLRSMSSR